ncbi:MAG: hypothetical protein WDN27_05265 [Candidatus Saccharibacteria bacterium]
MRYLAADQALFVLIGPSAVGKTTLAKRLADAGLVEVTPSWTTRPRRANEADDFEHLFCSEEEFDAALAAGRFLDTVQPFNDKARYGLPRPLRRRMERCRSSCYDPSCCRNCLPIILTPSFIR